MSGIAAANVGTSLGPVLGGWIAFSSGNVWWVFLSLVIFGGVIVVSIVMLFPETARIIVGNGSLSDAVSNYPLWRLFYSLWSKGHIVVIYPRSKNMMMC